MTYAIQVLGYFLVVQKQQAWAFFLQKLVKEIFHHQRLLQLHKFSSVI